MVCLYRYKDMPICPISVPIQLNQNTGTDIVKTDMSNHEWIHWFLTISSHLVYRNRCSINLFFFTEPWWLRGLIEHNQFLTLSGEGSNPGVAVYDELIRSYMVGRRPRILPQWVQIWHLPWECLNVSRTI